MEIVKWLRYQFAKFIRWEYAWLFLVLAAILAMHFSIINSPNEPLFDEKYYVQDARDILDRHAVTRWEHPPLGQLLITSGVFVFGDNQLGWRFLSVIFGVLSIVLFYLICRRLGMSKRTSYFATFILGFENMNFLQASVAMLDVYTVTFMLAAFWFYLRGNYLLTGIMICLSTLAKLSGAMTLPIIAMHWLILRRDRPVQFSASLILPILLFFELLPLLDFIVTGHFVDPVARIYYLVVQTSKVTYSYATHPYAFRPWDWLIWPLVMPYWYKPYYTAAISFTVWALILPSVVYMIVRALKGNEAGVFGLMWFISTYLTLTLFSLIGDRITYLFYFYPTVGAICIGIALGLSKLIDFDETRKSWIKWIAILGVSAFFILHIGAFVILSPIFAQQTTLIPSLNAP